ncbi:MAG TPA: tetratricopeptide repeat protein [Rhizomicrobium sp.]|jgi:tetratricopeptide (TPR) repeat protein|nr:tetratricopeptide repeat protein [Rhizomicrobium sp.]
MKLKLAFLLGVAAVLAVTQAPAQENYRQIRDAFKYCTARTNEDPNLLVKACLSVVDAGVIGADLAEAWADVAYADLELQQYDAAVIAAGKGIDADPKVWQSYFNRGSAYAHLRKYDLALADFNIAVDLAPREASPIGGRGAIELIQHNTDAALADLSKSVELDPDDAHAHAFRARLYHEMGQQDLADADIKELQRIDPDNKTGLMQLAAPAAQH